MVTGGGPPILRRVPSAAGSDVTVSSIDNIIQELLSHAEMEVEDSVRSIEEASLGRAANPTQPQPKGDAPSSLAEDLPPVEAEESFTPSFAQESSVWYEAQAEFDHLSDVEAANAAARAEVGLGSNDEEDEEKDVAGPSERGASDDLSDSESDFSLGSSTPGAGRRGRGYSDRDAIKSVQTRLLSVMKKEAKLHIKAEMAKTESDVLRGKVRAAEERTRRWEAKCKALEAKCAKLRGQDAYQQCRRLQSSLAKSTELNSKLVHKIQALKLELRKEKARRHHAEQAARMSADRRGVRLDAGDSMESLGGYQAESALGSSGAAATHFDSTDRGYEITDLRNQVRHLSGALDQAEAANSAILTSLRGGGQTAGGTRAERAWRREEEPGAEDEAAVAPVVSLNNFMAKPVIEEVKSSLAELKSSITAEDRLSGGQWHQSRGDWSASEAEREEDPDHPASRGGGVGLHYASQIPPQNMDKEDLRQAREAYQQEVRRMRQLFLSRQEIVSPKTTPS